MVFFKICRKKGLWLECNKKPNPTDQIRSMEYVHYIYAQKLALINVTFSTHIKQAIKRHEKYSLYAESLYKCKREYSPAYICIPRCYSP